MGGKAFAELDEGSRFLHQSWDSVLRIFLFVSLLSVLTWAFVRLLAFAIHEAIHHLFANEMSPEASRWWLLFALLTIGGIARGILVRLPGWADAAGDGMEVALSNYHCSHSDEVEDPRVRYQKPTFHLAFKKAAMTFLTLGTGGSGGLEAPVVTIGEALGAGLSKLLRVRSEHELQTYQLAAIATAVSTLLGAPFTAALFAIEIAYGDRISYRKLAYCLLAALWAYVLNNHWLGHRPLFLAPTHDPTYTLTEYSMTALVAVTVSAPLAWGFGRVTLQAKALVARVHRLTAGATGALGAGLVALCLYIGFDIAPAHVLGMGEETLQALLVNEPDRVVQSIGLLGLVLLGKMVATGLTIQSGGSAGILIPAMYMGGVSGALTALAIESTGWMSLDPALFVVVGIASALVAVIGVPLAAIALVLEIFGTEYGPPAILACGLTYVFSLRMRVYRSHKNDDDG